MKPLKIVMSAFGPFAEQSELSFEAFDGKGLFLITGVTGAGKTTIFDAIAFALYGRASGGVRSIDTLRSDFSKNHIKTYIELLFMHKEKEYCIRRNPSYSRLKKNGEGFTTENADATLTLPNGDMISGVREVDTKIIELLGITYQQFKQIAMIAQGEFMQLLLSSSKDRGEIFRRIFNTELYQRVQELLKENEKKEKQNLDVLEQGILQYIRGISWDLSLIEENTWIENPTIHTANDTLILLTQFITKDQKQKKDIKQQLNKNQVKINSLISDITKAKYIDKLFLEYEQAKQSHDILLQKSDEIFQKKKQLKEAEKAFYKLYPLEKEFLREKEESVKLQSELKDLEALITKQETDYVLYFECYQKELKKESEREQLSSQIDRFQQLLPKYNEVENLSREIKKLNDIEEEISSSILQLSNKKESILAKITESNERLNQLEGIEINYADCIKEKDFLENLIKDILYLKTYGQKINLMQEEVTRLQNDFCKIEKSFLEKNKNYEKKESLFFREIAGILADSLADDTPCPVCGSMNHPKKAVKGVDAPSEAEILKLRKEVEKLRSDRESLSKTISEKETQIKLTRQHFISEAFLSFEKIPITKETLMDRFGVSVLSTEEQVLKVVEEAIADCMQKQKESQKRIREVLTKIELKKKCKEEVENFEKIINENTKNLAKAESDKYSLAKEIASKEGMYSQLSIALECKDKKEAEKSIDFYKKELKKLKTALNDAEKTYHEIHSKLDRNKALLENMKNRYQDLTIKKEDVWVKYEDAIKNLDFSDEENYHNALRTEKEIKALKLEIDLYDEEFIKVNSDLERLSKETAEEEKVDVKKIEFEKGEFEVEKRNLEAKEQMIMARLGINEQVKQYLNSALSEWSSKKEQYLLIRNLSKTANGDLSGKQKLAFEQYVQASYFSKILEEANKRLLEMTNNRFLLYRREAPVNLRLQTGLDIDVYDHYTGKKRSVNSLSGGEAFKASLALALGLSDVIQSYAGGVEMDALFIDEGFGALDFESLQQAVITLTKLAKGNRLVGIISHVSELKQWIDRQVVIHKSNQGSLITVEI